MRRAVLLILAVRQRLSTIAALLSLLACLATAALWAASYWRVIYPNYDTYDHGRRVHRSYSILIEAGGVRLQLARTSFDQDDSLGLWDEEITKMPPGLRWVGVSPPTYPFDYGISDKSLANRLGFYGEMTEQDDYNGYSEYDLVLPLYAVTLTTLPMPLWWLWGRRKARQRQRKGQCLTCGYDLRESKERCPECGTPTSAKALSTGRNCQG